MFGLVGLDRYVWFGLLDKDNRQRPQVPLKLEVWLSQFGLVGLIR